MDLIVGVHLQGLCGNLARTCHPSGHQTMGKLMINHGMINHGMINHGMINHGMVYGYPILRQPKPNENYDELIWAMRQCYRKVSFLWIWWLCVLGRWESPSACIADKLGGIDDASAWDQPNGTNGTVTGPTRPGGFVLGMALQCFTGGPQPHPSVLCICRSFIWVCLKMGYTPNEIAI